MSDAFASDAASRHIGRLDAALYLRTMTDTPSGAPKAPAQIYAPLQAWFAAKAQEPTPEHLVALVDELEANAEALGRKAG